MRFLIAFALTACDTPVALFSATAGKVDAACTNPVDYCARARCDVKNLGPSSAPATVTFTLYRPDGTKITAQEFVMLDPGEETEIHHDFAEARLADDDELKVDCSASAGD